MTPGQQTAGDPVPGKRWGYFDVLAQLGRGVHGVVHSARHLPSGLACALKVYRALPDSPSRWARAKREVEVLERLQHPGIVRLIDAGLLSGRLYCATERIDGGSLADLVETGGPLPAGQALRLTGQVARALGHAHEAGVIHRDLRPDNVLLSAGGVARVVDFGLAKDLSTAELTRTGTLLGTPHYAAPEQLGEAKRVDPRADVYALGALLHFLVSGRPPYSAKTLEELYLRIQDGSPQLHTGLTEPGLSLINQLLARTVALDPAQRYQSMQALADEVERALERLASSGSPGQETDVMPVRAPASSDGVIGSTIGPCRVERMIGEGAAGQVFEALHGRLQKRVVLKLLQGTKATDMKRFSLEAKAAARIANPYVAKVLDYGEQQGQHYIVQELVEGESLDLHVERSGPLSLEATVELGVGLATGLKAVHEGSLVHRDLKPLNVVISAEGAPKIIDFGIAMDLSASSASVTQTGVFVGTPLYLAPEQLRGREGVGPKADLFGLGGVLHFALTGQGPHQLSEDDTLMGLLARRMHQPITSLREDRPDLPAALDGLIVRLLEIEPEARPTATEVLRELLDLRVGRSVRRPSPAEPGRETPLAVFAALAVAVVVLALVAGWALGSRAEVADTSPTGGETSGEDSGAQPVDPPPSEPVMDPEPDPPADRTPPESEPEPEPEQPADMAPIDTQSGPSSEVLAKVDATEAWIRENPGSVGERWRRTRDLLSEHPQLWDEARVEQPNTEARAALEGLFKRSQGDAQKLIDDERWWDAETVYREFLDAHGSDLPASVPAVATWDTLARLRQARLSADLERLEALAKRGDGEAERLGAVVLRYAGPESAPLVEAKLVLAPEAPKPGAETSAEPHSKERLAALRAFFHGEVNVPEADDPQRIELVYHFKDRDEALDWVPREDVPGPVELANFLKGLASKRPRGVRKPWTVARKALVGYGWSEVQLLAPFNTHHPMHIEIEANGTRNLLCSLNGIVAGVGYRIDDLPVEGLKAGDEGLRTHLLDQRHWSRQNTPASVLIRRGGLLDHEKLHARVEPVNDHHYQIELFPEPEDSDVSHRISLDRPGLDPLALPTFEGRAWAGLLTLGATVEYREVRVAGHLDPDFLERIDRSWREAKGKARAFRALARERVEALRKH